jgi:predicted phosphodiesterase
VLELDAVVWAGDVFDAKQPARSSHRLVLRAIEAVKRYKNLWVVVGNHDISNDRLETIKEQQPLGVLFEAGAHELDGWHPELPIFGVPWQQRWLEDGAAARALAGWKEEFTEDELAKSLVVTHAPIYPPAEARGVKFELVDTSELAEAMGNVGSLYYGHIHEDHGVYEVDGVSFCNVGAISRGSLTEYNKKRSIKAALWTPEDGFFEIDLPHKPAEEVLLIESGEKTKQDRISLDGFLADVGSTILDVSSTAGVIEHIQKLDEEKIPRPVKFIAIELLEAQDA